MEYNCFNCPYYRPENDKCSSLTEGVGYVTKQDVVYCNFYKSYYLNKLGENHVRD